MSKFLHSLLLILFFVPQLSLWQEAFAAEEGGKTLDALINALGNDRDNNDVSPTPTSPTMPQGAGAEPLTKQEASNKIIKFFESIYGEFGQDMPKSAVYGTIAIAVLGVFFIRTSPIIGLIMIFAPTTVYYFVQKIIKMMG